MKTTEVKDTQAIRRLAERIAKKTVQRDNSSMPAGSPMYFYCRLCAVLCDTRPELYIAIPKKYCNECQDLKNINELTDVTLKELAAKVEL